MKKTRLAFTLALAFVAFLSHASEIQRSRIARRDTLPIDPALDEMVVVGNDTVPMIMPEKNYGRYNRGLYNYLYIPRRSWALGLTASYGSFGTDDAQVLSLLKNVDFTGKIYSIRPSASYFFSNNHSAGVRLDYTRAVADLANLEMDIDDDMSFTLHDVNYTANTFKLGFFYRNYVGLGRASRFAVFNEVAVETGYGASRFKRWYSDVLYDTETQSLTANLNFSPGLSVFIQDYVAFNISFGVFGLHLTKEWQNTNGADKGSRLSSGANFRFNIFNINFGLLVVI